MKKLQLGKRVVSIATIATTLMAGTLNFGITAVTASSSAVYTEGEAGAILDPTITVTGGNFADGYLLFTMQNSRPGDVLTITTPSDPNKDGAISRDGDSVYIGTGTSKRKIGEVDGTQNGLSGRPLKILLSSPMENSGFETGDTTGWSVDNRYIALSGDTGTGITTSSGVVSNHSGISPYEGNKFLYLQIVGSTTVGFGTAHGPSVKSNTFEASQGDTVALNWYAMDSGDDYDVYGYLIDESTGDRTQLFYQRGDNTGGWQSIQATIPKYSNRFRFEFICGTYDATGGKAVGSLMFIDNVRVFSALANAATATSIARSVEFHSTDDQPTSDPRTPENRNWTLETKDNTGTITKPATGSVTVNPTPDAPFVSTGLASNIKASSATIGGNVTSDDGANVTERGIEYKKSSDSQFIKAASASAGEGQYSVNVTGLTEQTTYEFRTYAVNSAGERASTPLGSFTTPMNQPPVGNSFSINNDAEFSNNQQVQLSVSATDPDDTVAEMSFSIDGQAWTAWEPYAATATLSLPTTDGTHTIRVKFKDSNGKESSGTPLEDSIKLDLTAPVSSGIVNPNLYGGVYYHNEDVTPGFNFDISGRSNLQSFKLVNGDKQPYVWSDGDIVSAEGTYQFVATDIAGNVGTYTFVIDKTKPSAAPSINVVSENTGANDGMKVIVTKPSSEANDPSGKFVYTTDGSVPAPGNPANQDYPDGGILFDEEGTYTVRSSFVDAAGNYGPPRTLVFVVDKTNPTIEDVSDTNYNWRTEDANVTLTVNDALTGVTMKEYAWSTESDPDQSFDWQSDDSEGMEVQANQTQDGIWYLWYQITDAAGNVTKGNYGPYKIDKTAPDKPSVDVSNDYVSGTWSEQNVELSLSSQDDASGVQYYEYSTSADGESWSSWSRLPGNTAAFGDQQLVTDQYVKFRAVNGAEVSSDESEAWQVRIDKEAPAITGINNNEYTNANTVTVSFSDAGAGLTAAEYQMNDGDWNTISVEDGAMTFTEEGRYSIRIEDGVGNQSTVDFIIDRTLPEITGVDNESYNGGPVTPGVTDVNLQNISVSRNGDPYVWTSGAEITEDGDYSINATDFAGNSSSVMFTIDTTAPVINGAADGQKYNDSVSPEIVELNTASIVLTKDGQPYPFESGYELYEDGVYVLEVTDKSNNSASVSFVIDTQAPEVTIVEDGMYYNAAVKPEVEFGLSGKQSLTLNGADWTSGTKIFADGNYVLYAEDQAGNSTTVNFTIDTIKPNEPLVEVVQEENRTNVYIQMTMPAGEDPGTPDDKQQGRLVYTLNGKNPTATSTSYSGIFEIDENGTYTVKAAYIDRAGNIGKIATLIVTVDITPPKYESIENGAYYKNDVTPEFTEHSSLVSEKFNEVTKVWEPYPWTNNTAITEEGTYRITAEDLYSNRAVVEFTIDKTAPDASGVDQAQYTGDDLPVIPQFADFSEVTAKVKKTADGAWEDYIWTNGDAITEDGEYEIIAVDEAGNETTVSFTIDTESPEVVANDSSSDWRNNVDGVQLEISDSVSGVATGQYAWSADGNAAQGDITWNDYSNPVTNPGDGEWYLYYLVVDEVGNSSFGKIGPYRIDATAPTAVIDYSTTEMGNVDVIASLQSSEDVTVTNNNGSDTYVFTENGSFTFEFVDRAGNIGSATATVNNIDKVVAETTLSYSETEPTNQDVIATLESDEPITITNNGGSATYTFTGNGEFTFEYVDAYGNVGSSKAVVGNVDKVAPTGSVVINGGAAVSNSRTVELNITIEDNAGPGALSMRYSEDGETWTDWEAARVTKSYEISDYGTKTIYVQVKDPAGNVVTFNDTIRVDRPSTPAPSTTAPGPVVEELKVNVEDGDTRDVVSTATIQRTTEADGTKKDKVTFSAEEAKATVEKVNASGGNTARIVIPDNKDEISETMINIPKATLDTIRSGNIGLGIETENASILIPKESLDGLNNDIFFRVVPIKDQAERDAVEKRAKSEQVVINIAGNNGISIVGRPAVIETNMESRAVDIVLPLKDVVLPTDPQEREAFLNNLVVFIEHSDGEKAASKGTIVTTKDNQLAIQFRIEKFSTFTILHIDGSEQHKAYIYGYPDDSFKPEAAVTRAEIAAILSRVIDLSGDTGQNGKHYPDVAAGFWAEANINQVTSASLMQGYLDGTFKPGNHITRAEMATIVARWMGLDTASSHSFNDVKGHWAEQAISAASEAGYLKGFTDGSFKPDKVLTRAEAVTIINRIIGREALTTVANPSWSDVAATYWAFYDIEEASRDHLVTEHE
jgi:Fibronectin type III domain./S-layer homology domain.